MGTSTVTFLLLSLAAFVPCRGPAPNAIHVAAANPDSVIDRVLAAYGGADAIRSIDSYRQEGVIVAVQGGAHGRLYRVSGGSDRLSVRMEYPDRSEIRILNAGAARRGASEATLAEVSGMLEDAMVLQAARSWLPWLLMDRRSDAVLAESAGGRTILDVRIADDLLLRVFVDDVTSLIVRTESVLESAPGPVGFATDYSDFRPVSGVVFAFHEETFASGLHTGSVVLESVELNPRSERAGLPVSKAR